VKCKRGWRNFRERRQHEVRRIYPPSTGAELFDDAVSAETQAHRSNGPYQRIGLRHPLYALQPFAAHRHEGRGFGTVVYC
jgi:hypothetical protein